MRLPSILLLLFLGISVAAAAELRVAAVTDGDTVTLTDGQHVRLYGIMAPKLSLGRKHITDWPLAHEAKAHLQKMTTGTVALRPAPQPRDVHGRTLAELVLPDGGSAQAAMVKAGMARVYTLSDNPNIAKALLPLEATARQNKVGIWALPYYAIRTPDNIRRDMNSFQIVQGTVKAVAKVQGTTYINFGDNWREDFTISTTNAIAKKLKADTLAGNPIRVRGWVHSKNGPMITVTHIQQVELP